MFFLCDFEGQLKVKIGFFMKCKLVVLLMLVMSATLFGGEADDLWNKAFRDVDAGEKALRLKNGFDAEGHFRKALNSFLKIRADYPKWESGSVNFRINECRSKMEEANKIRSEKRVSHDLADINGKLDAALKERDKYSAAMMLAYQKNKTYEREIAVLRKLVAQAQREASDESSQSSGLEDVLMAQHKLELELKAKERELVNLKKTLKDNVTEQSKLKELELQERTSDLAEKELELTKRLAVLDEEKAQASNQYDALRVVHLELKALALKTERELKKTAEEARAVKETLKEHKDRADDLQEQNREWSERVKLAKQREADVLKREKDLRLSLDDKLSKEIKTQHDLQSKYDDLNTKYTDLELRLAQELRVSQKSQGDLVDLERSMSKLKLDYEDVKNKLIVRDTSRTNTLRNELLAVSNNYKRTFDELTEKNKLVELLKKRLKANSAQLQLSLQQLAPSKEPVDDSASEASDAQALKYIKQYEEAELRSQKLNKELMSLRLHVKESRRASMLDEEELIKKLVDYKEENKALKLANEQLNLAQGTKTVLSAKEMPRQDNSQLSEFIYEAYKAQTEGEVQVAFGFYAKALELDPQSLDALLRAGLLYYELGQLSEAERYLSRAFYQSPDDVNILIGLGMCLSEKGEYLMALSLLSRAASLKPDNAEVRLNLGAIMQAQGWNSSALQETEKAFELDGENPQVLINLAILYLAQSPKRLDDAKEMYQKAISLGAAKTPLLEQLIGSN